MKARIDKSGCLEIERAVKWKAQECYPSLTGRCGDWCPLFVEINSIHEDNMEVALRCSPTGVGHEITADARPKAGGA